MFLNNKKESVFLLYMRNNITITTYTIIIIYNLKN